MNPGAIGAFSGIAVGLGVAFGIAALRPAPASNRLRWPRRLSVTQFKGRSRKLGICAAIGLAAGLATGWPVAVLAGGFGAWWLPLLLGADRDAARQLARTEAVAAFTEMVRDTLSAAAGVGQAVRSAANSAPAPIAAEARLLAQRIDDGMPIADALSAFSDDLQDPTADIVVVCLVHAIRHNARDLVALLGALAGTTREHAALRKRAQAARVQVRTSMRIITAVSAGMFGALYLLDRTFLAPYSTASGQFVLACALGLFAAGYAWMWRMARTRSRPRLLTRADHRQEVGGW